jgi:hypothetical protein
MYPISNIALFVVFQKDVVMAPEGDFRYEISAILLFPTHIASSSKADTIAVCDTHLKNVIILDYQGKVQSLYKGWGRLHLASCIYIYYRKDVSVHLLQCFYFVVLIIQ